ncbi:hypothetical protein V866_008742 [Kwoniella sp. B9012]
MDTHSTTNHGEEVYSDSDSAQMMGTGVGSDQAPDFGYMEIEAEAFTTLNLQIGSLGCPSSTSPRYPQFPVVFGPGSIPVVVRHVEGDRFFNFHQMGGKAREISWDEIEMAMGSDAEIDAWTCDWESLTISELRAAFESLHRPYHLNSLNVFIGESQLKEALQFPSAITEMDIRIGAEERSASLTDWHIGDNFYPSWVVLLSGKKRWMTIDPRKGNHKVEFERFGKVLRSRGAL